MKRERNFTLIPNNTAPKTMILEGKLSIKIDSFVGLSFKNWVNIREGNFTSFDFHIHIIFHFVRFFITDRWSGDETHIFLQISEGLMQTFMNKICRKMRMQQNYLLSLNYYLFSVVWEISSVVNAWWHCQLSHRYLRWLCYKLSNEVTRYPKFMFWHP